MSTSIIKQFAGQKMLIVSNITKADVKALYTEAKSLKIPFAVKTDTGVQVWGLFTVCEYLGISDHSTFFN